MPQKGANHTKQSTHRDLVVAARSCLAFRPASHFNRKERKDHKASQIFQSSNLPVFHPSNPSFSTSLRRRRIPGSACPRLCVSARTIPNFSTSIQFPRLSSLCSLCLRERIISIPGKNNVPILLRSLRSVMTKTICVNPCSSVVHASASATPDPIESPPRETNRFIRHFLPIAVKADN